MPRRMDVAEQARRLAARRQREFAEQKRVFAQGEMQRELDEANLEGAKSIATGKLRTELKGRPIRNRILQRTIAMGEKARDVDARVQAMKRKGRRRMTIAEGR